MQTLVLIDGNSLLNRAYYATGHLSTKDGTPTNAVFGFVKLLFKLIDTFAPEKLIVTFDLKAPTFRHKMYDRYKATRKPMPDDLAVQVGMLKSLLSSMRIAMCEKEGYEADDLIGTLSHAFPETKSIIVTGDRDAYQLVDEVTDVCLTKTGVSNLLHLTAENFESEIGYKPEQVIEMKALMGDASDNIPGVSGVGEKTARMLIDRYQSLEGVYAHLSELGGTLAKKLEEGEESARLSRTLATIDRSVPLAVSEDCGIHIPFSEEVYRQFVQLEFTSLIKPELFEREADVLKREGCAKKETVVSQDGLNSMQAALRRADMFSAVFSENSFYFSDGACEFEVRIARTLLDEGVREGELCDSLKAIFGKGGKTVLYGVKDFRHVLDGYGAELLCDAEDVSLMKYLTDYTGKDDNLSLTLQSYGLDVSTPAYGVFRLFSVFSKKLEDEKMQSLYRNIELPLTKVLYDMEVCGVKVDFSASARFEALYRAEIAKATADIYAQAGEEFNINSPAQLGKILFEKLKIPSSKKSKRGYSTSVEVLDKLKDRYKIVRDVLRCRHYQKLLSTYIDGFRPHIDPATGIVHTRYNQIQTTTGRLSSSNPNLQNIPIRNEDGRELRKLFVARAKDRILVDADYSQIELRLLAHFSGCKELIDAYKSGMDIHALTASQVFGVPLAEVSAEQRRAAKAVNFGIIYGISDFGLATNLNISTKQAGEYIDRYFERYSDVKKYMDANVAFAREHGYVCTLSGRKRVINEIRSSNFNIRSFGERAAMNMPLQGSCADIIKIAMINLYERLNKEGLRSKLILQVHDELVLDAFADERERVQDIVKEEMENAVSLRVPLVADVHFGKNWYEAK